MTTDQGTTTTYFVGNYYELTGSVVTKYYYAGSQRIAMRVGGTLSFLISDHLGSTSLSTDANGTVTSEQRYTAWGEVRFSSSDLPTQYTYTGQYSYTTDFGLLFYNARWVDPYLNRWTQPDSIVPDPSNPQSLDRYSYVLNNPIRYTDPSGHNFCDEDGNCYGAKGWYRAPGAPRLSVIDTYKKMINVEFGITMVDNKTKWSLTNVQTTYRALNMINNVLNSNLRTMVRGTTFTMTDGGNQYYGITGSTGVTFHVASSNTQIPLTNFLHETGHLLDFVPATNDVFSGSLPKSPTWVKNGYVNSELLLGKLADPVQAQPMNEPYDPHEYWADAFANYVAGNINLAKSEGADMATDVANALQPYVNP